MKKSQRDDLESSEFEPGKHKVGVLTNKLNEMHIVSDATEPESQQEMKHEDSAEEEFQDDYEDVYCKRLNQQLEDEELATEQEEKDAVADLEEIKESSPHVNLFRNHKLKKDEEFVFDNSAYETLHRCNAEWPCLSFDILLDQRRHLPEAFSSLDKYPIFSNTDYPMETYIVSGSQADKAKQNKLYIMKWTNLRKTKDDDTPDSDSDSGDEADSNPMLYFETVNHYGATNRVRSLGGTPLVATWSDQRQINIFDVSKWMNLLDERHASQKLSMKRKHIKSRLGNMQMKEEGFALDWNKLNPGQLAVGDCLGQICICLPTDSSFSSWTKDGAMLTGHGGSVEDVQFSKTQPHVLGSVSVDGSIRIWDLREGKRKESYKFDAHDCDINVMSWSQKNEYNIAIGADDGTFQIWDIRKPKKPRASIRWHGQAITSISWGPNSDNVLALSSEDDRLSVWDFAMEADTRDDTISDETGAQIPEQLMFLHAGQQNIKELKFHPKYDSVLLTTAGSGFNFFKPNLMEEEEEIIED